MLEPLISEEEMSKRLPYKPSAVIMGRTGAGKTTLVNMLCGTKHACGAGTGSITRNLYRNDVNCGDNSFSLIDTSGTNSTKETYKHAYLLKHALKATPINTRFIVVKYECRFDTMLENYYETEQPVYNYDKKIVAMILHWDLSKEPEKEFSGICKLFQGYCSNLICYSDKSSEIDIANFIYSCISNMEREQLEINDKDFFFNFNVAEIKLRTRRSLDQYRKKTELDHYMFYIKMEKETVKLRDLFVVKVMPLMSYNLFDNEDPRNLIKKSPNCNLIWFKTEGCDGVTHCGNYEFENYFDQRTTPFRKYLLERIDGKLRWSKNDSEQEHNEITTQKFNNATRVGCGEVFVWSELPKIEDNVILEFLKSKTMKEAIQLFQSGNFKEVRQEYESNIDSNFYS